MENLKIQSTSRKDFLIDKITDQFSGMISENWDAITICNGFESVIFERIYDDNDDIDIMYEDEIYKIYISDCYYDRGQQIRDFIIENYKYLLYDKNKNIYDIYNEKFNKK